MTDVTDELEDGAIIIDRVNNGWTLGHVKNGKVEVQVFQDEDDDLGHVRALVDLIKTAFKRELRGKKHGGMAISVSTIGRYDYSKRGNTKFTGD